MNLDTQLRAATKLLKDLDIPKQSDYEQQQIYCTILYFIQSAPHLSMVYLNWASLKPYEKCILNKQIIRGLPRNAEYIYPPLLRAFEYWDMLQDTFGAPGFEYIPFTSELSDETNRDIVRMLYVMEQTINQIQIKRKVMQDLSSYRDKGDILYSYKWRVVYKYLYNLRNINAHVTDSSDRSDDGSYVSDLNGCGDTTWHYDYQD